MADVSEAASTTWSQQEVTVDKGRTEELSISPRSTSPTSTVDTSVASSRSLRHQGLTPGPSMGSQESDREKKEHISKEKSPKVALAATSGTIINREERCGDPDPDEITHQPVSSSVVVPSVVVPSVIRVSPLAPGKASVETGSRDSSRIVPVVRPFAVKTSHQASNVRGEVDPERVSTQVSVAVEHAVQRSEALGNQNGKGSVQQQQQPSAKGVGRSDTPTPHIDEVRRRQEAQVSFPARVPAREHQEHIPRTSGRRADMSRVNGQQPPIPNVHYRQHHSHGRAASNRATSITSSVDGTPTLTARGAQVRRDMSASSHENDSDMSPTIHPEPLFQRLVTEEVQELKHYTRIIEEQNHRLNEVENITDDLDRKLQKQTKARTDLERTLELRERQWADKFEKLEADRDHWKEVVRQEKQMNTRLNDQVARMEQEIHRMLQRKVRVPYVMRCNVFVL